MNKLSRSSVKAAVENLKLSVDCGQFIRFPKLSVLPTPVSANRCLPRKVTVLYLPSGYVTYIVTAYTVTAISSVGSSTAFALRDKNTARVSERQKLLTPLISHPFMTTHIVEVLQQLSMKVLRPAPQPNLPCTLHQSSVSRSLAASLEDTNSKPWFVIMTQWRQRDSRDRQIFCDHFFGYWQCLKKDANLAY